MSDKPARFQIRLSTAIALTIVAGAILGMNVVRHFEIVLSQGDFAYGWPMPVYFHGGPMRGIRWRFSGEGLAFNLVYCSVLLMIVKHAWDACAHYKGLGAAIRRVPAISLVAFTGITILIVRANLNRSSPPGWPAEVYSDYMFWFSLASNITFAVMAPYSAAWLIGKLVNVARLLS